MNAQEKINSLKDAITQLYSKEGRSINYIANLLDLNRKRLTTTIKKTWNLTETDPRHHLTPSNQKFVNRHRQFIKSKLDQNWTLKDIANHLQISDTKLSQLIRADQSLSKSYTEWKNRHYNHREQRNQMSITQSHKTCITDKDNLPHEIWKNILGYPNYQVSSYGRIRKYHPWYNAYTLVAQSPNQHNHRLYVWLQDKSSKNHGLQVSRLVAFNFCQGHSNIQNTVDHIDGNQQNNKASNLRWIQ